MDIKEVAMISAQWWAKQLFKPSNWDGGPGNEKVEGIVNNLKDMLSQPVSCDQEQLFVDKLIELIEEEVNYRKAQKTQITIDLISDYGPSGILEEAAEYAGIDRFTFPFKTRLTISDWDNDIKAGPMGQTEVIWTAA